MVAGGLPLGQVRTLKKEFSVAYRRGDTGARHAGVNFIKCEDIRKGELFVQLRQCLHKISGW